MKKTISSIIIFSLLFYMLIAPGKAVSAAATGLILWYKTILPTLLPFAILANIFIFSNIFYLFCRFFHPLIRMFLPVSREGTFPLISGFLFGFPMGSRMCASMLSEQKLSYDEASIIFIISNNMSPMFVCSYILDQCLHLPEIVLPTILALYLPPILVGKILFAFFKIHPAPVHEKTTSRFQLNFKIIDAAIMNGFEALTKLGGYIMLFSIISSMITLLPLSSVLFKSLCVGTIEITNGIQTVTDTALHISTKYILCISFTAFGGLSGIAQTSSMISGSNLSMKNYIFVKILLCICSTVLAALFYHIVY